MKTFKLGAVCAAVAAAGLLGAPGAQAAGTPEEIKAATDALMATLQKIADSQYASKLKAAHDPLANYAWRTVYRLEQVSRESPPGKVLTAREDPKMGQTDAEDFYTGVPGYNGVPPMNCPGGPLLTKQLGRPFVVTNPANNASVALTDTMISALLLKASPDQGAQAWQVMSAMRNAMCTAIYNTAQLSYRYQRFLTVQTNWAQCAAEGVRVGEWQVPSVRLGFPNGQHRSVAANGVVMWRCGAGYNGSLEDAFFYDSLLKWSDNLPSLLPLRKPLKDAEDSGSNCPQACIEPFRNAGVDGWFCLGASPRSASGETVLLKLGVKVQAWNYDPKYVCAPPITVPAPLALSNSLQEMADPARQQKKTELQTQLRELLPITKDMMQQLQALALKVM